MAIDGGLRGKLVVGTRLVARYKGVDHSAEVAAGEDGKVRYRLADGREFKSLSAAASAVMGGIAANGWRWWSLDAGDPARTTTATPAAATAGTQAAPVSPSAARPRCARCGKSFVGPVQFAHHEAHAARLCLTA